MTVHVITPWAKTDLPAYSVVSNSGEWASLSPFTLGPVPLYAGYYSQNMENGWQFSKVYPEYVNDRVGYWGWAKNGWNDPRAHRYPMGKGAVPAYSLWCGDELGYIDARKRIYIPLYSHAVRFHAYSPLGMLRQKHKLYGEIALRDYDSYDRVGLGYTWDDVVNDPSRKMGHGFVLAMMIEGAL